jgi:LuxR family maltose regulon positive regulatory protein
VTTPLLKTKLYIPPVRPKLVPRPRLIERLNAGLGQSGGFARKLTLISAPAGFGKTTLLSEWVRQCAVPVAWLSLDNDDDDPVRFWTYLLAALETLDVGLAQGALQLADAASESPSAQAILVPLLNEVAALPDKIVLVVDDYHLVSTQAIHDGIAFLIAHQPPQLHLVLSTRADPPLPVVRLRARGQLTELRADDLRFTLDEASAFLNGTMGIDLSPRDVDSLGARTEGWIVGLQLAALSMQGRTDRHAFVSTFTGSHHYILAYLTEEVLHRLPESVRRFLLRTSILDRLCGPLCDAVLGRRDQDGRAGSQADSRETLAYLASSNLFLIALDGERYWYRYHHLFADLLRKRLRQEMSSEAVFELHRRASAWYEEHGPVDEAVKYALRVQDFERVAYLAEEAARAGMLDSRPTVLLRWLEALPEEVLLPHPRLCLHQAWALILNERLDVARRILQETQGTLRSMPPSPEDDAELDELGTLLAAIEAMALGLAHGYAGNVVEAAREGATAREKALALGNRSMAVHATVGLALAQFHQGHLRQAAEHYRRVIDLAERSSGTEQEASPSPLAAPGYVGLANIYLEWNDLDAAANYLDQGMELGRHGAAAHSLVNACVVRSRLRQALGDWEGAFEALDQAEQIYRAQDSPAAMLRLGGQRARLNLTSGQVDDAIRWIQGVEAGLIPGLSGKALPGALYEAVQILSARAYLAQGEAAQALAILGSLSVPAEAADRRGRVAEIRLLEALACQVQGRTADALAPLARSLSIAEPEGYARLYLDEGAPAAELLRVYVRDPSTPPHLGTCARDLLAAYPDVGLPASIGPEPPGESALAEPLTQRESQVLLLIYEGHSNRKIAEQLVLALNTVKRHTSNIYGKLGVNSRTQAIARARQLGLLPAD